MAQEVKEQLSTTEVAEDYFNYLKKKGPQYQEAMKVALTGELHPDHPVSFTYDVKVFGEVGEMIEEMAYLGYDLKEEMDIKKKLYTLLTGKEGVHQSVRNINLEQVREQFGRANEAREEQLLESNIRNQRETTRGVVDSILTGLELQKVGEGTTMTFDEDGEIRKYEVRTHNREQGVITMVEVGGGRIKSIRYKALASTTKGLIDINYVKPSKTPRNLQKAMQQILPNDEGEQYAVAYEEELRNKKAQTETRRAQENKERDQRMEQARRKALRKKKKKGSDAVA